MIFRQTLSISLLILCSALFCRVQISYAQIHDYYDEESVIAIESQEDWKSHNSESGIFTLFYVTEGSNRVPDLDESQSGVPDFIELAASYADSTWRFLIQHHGYPDFSPTDTTYSIYFRDAPYLGFTRKFENTTQIILHRNFEDIRSGNTTIPPPDNLDPDGRAIGALKNTIAHEIMHAIQYEVMGDFLEPAWLEMDAVMVAHHTFPDVFDYLNDIRSGSSIFNQPDQSTPVAYAHTSLMNYFTEQFGLGFWSDVWNLRNSDADLFMLDALLETLPQYDAPWARSFIQMHLWHFATGDRNHSDYGFQNSERYPTSRTIEHFTSPPNETQNLRSVSRLSAHYYKVDNDQDLTGSVYFSLYSNSLSATTGLLIYSDDAWNEVFPGESENGLIFHDTGYKWEDVDSLGIIITNPDIHQNMQYQFGIGNAETISNLLLGDVNRSATITQLDAALVLEHVNDARLLSGANIFKADVSGDGTISAYDAYLILSYVENGIQTFPADETGDGFGPDSVFFSTLVPENELEDSLKKPELTLDVISQDNRAEEPIRFGLSFDEIVNAYHAGTFTLSFDLDLEVNAIFFEQSKSNRLLDWHQNDQTVTFSFAQLDSLDTNQKLIVEVTTNTDGLLTITGKKAIFDEFYDHQGNWQNDLEIEVEPSIPVSTENQDLPEKVTLHQNYPNPFNPVTQIPFSISETGHVSLTIYDVLGRTVAALKNEILTAGQHTAEFDGSNFSSGIFIIRLEFNNQIITRRMVMIK